MTRITIGIAVLLVLTGCASLMNSATSRMADNLTLAILNQTDLETVRAGAPAYLLMIDGLIEGSPDNTDLLLAGTRLYSSYTSAFIADEDRAKRLASKSFAYARTALCNEISSLCDATTARPDDFLDGLASTDAGDVPVLYGFATAWASWIQANRSDWNALAGLPKLTALFEQCVALDEQFDYGGAHIYLGVLSTQLPPSLGGKPEKGRIHFERAIEISAGKNLMIKVLMAENYARLVFDRELHDQLLQTVLSDPAESPGLTLINTLAKQQASILLAESSDFF
jgi:hypothetical protein